ncbi:MAG: sulfate ABC transporter substrate-binding protein [Solirubrobacterales bacterium]|nr:MAG: sulfate ABC transporter substrate-binding protein [Solirubrobacterales bacterium]
MIDKQIFLKGSVIAAGALAGAAAVAGCGGSSDATSGASGARGAGGGPQLSLVAYSTPQTAYDALIPRYQQTPSGRRVRFSESYGASGAQSRAVDSGQPADVVAFSTTPDVTRLAKDGIVSSDWDANLHHGIVSDSVVVLVVRKGDPKHITGWDDLIKPGVDVITPNPSTSGSARWNILAAYGAELKEGRTPAQAQSYLKTLLAKHVSVQDSSGRAALQTFTGGKGDVLISYESEAIAARQKGIALDYMVPKQTILIETPIAVTSKSSHQSRAKAFVSWLWTPAAQAIWAQHGYRPVVASVLERFASEFPAPPQLFTVGFLGGWTSVVKTFFAPSTGVVTKIEQAAGVPTASS